MSFRGTAAGTQDGDLGFGERREKPTGPGGLAALCSVEGAVLWGPELPRAAQSCPERGRGCPLRDLSSWQVRPGQTAVRAEGPPWAPSGRPGRGGRP